ncbi:transposase, partial [Mycobacterium sp.]|uniref:transposase n=1 Tax=Mycobacterium sp. TaxID=1785 RepID=UPI0031E103AE
MAHGYRSGDRQQLFLLPPSMDEWLEEGHLAYFVIDTVRLIDTSAFHEIHPEGPGRPAYEPEMMLGLLLYAYATGVRSSRKIMAACRSDLAYKVIAVNLVPDHRTIARFRAENEEAIKSVFVEVLKVCDAAGLASVGQIAIDGTKVGSDAALDQNRQKDWIVAEINKILGDAAATDEAEDASPVLFETLLPEWIRGRHGRLERLQAALAQIEEQERAAREDEEAKAEHARVEAAQGRKLPGRKPTDPHAALRRAEADLQAVRVRAQTDPGVDVATAERLVSEAAAAAESAPPSSERIVANVTDPESRIMKTKDGWIQGYNVQAAVNAEQVVVGYETTQDHNDVNQLHPMIEATQHSAGAAGIEGDIGLTLADAGYWSEDNATAPGPNRLIATTKDWKQRKAARDLGTTTGPPPVDASVLEQMEHRLRTPEGAAAYATRSYTVEPVFGDVKENRGFRRFMR